MGTVFDLDEKQGVWFDLDGGGRVQLRTLSFDALKKITKQCTKKKVDFKKVEGTPGRFEYTEVDEDLQNELFWDHCIVSWENLLDSKGKEIPCTRENKVLLMVRVERFARFVADSLAELGAAEAEHEKAAEKN
jgi:hypothetical protein